MDLEDPYLVDLELAPELAPEVGLDQEDQDQDHSVIVLLSSVSAIRTRTMDVQQ